MFSKQSSDSWLIVGLGNPGREYEKTRHNTGFRAMDVLAEKLNAKVDRLKFQGLYTQVNYGGKKLFLLKPQTYMNLSGESVGEAARFYKIPADHVLVISDDVSLPAGKLRIRGGGSAGGHNGLKNIIQHLGTDRFPRIKVGVGSPRPGEHDMVDWVMGKPMGEDRTAVEDALDRAGDAAKTLITEGIDRAMNRFN